MTTITIGRAGNGRIHPTLMDGMHRLRADVFHARLGWDVKVRHGRERDHFDRAHPYYLLAHDALLPVTPAGRPPARVVGCCRVLPTLGPNMLRDVFPQLADSRGIPARADVWEVSRFAVATDTAAATGTAAGSYGFSTTPALMVAHLLRFCADRDISALVGVTSSPFERMLLKLGLEVAQLGRPRRIGRVMSLAFELPLDALNLRVADTIIAGVQAAAIAQDLPRAA
ncbi:GNAT family N-acetyltransferase [Lysobacter maris]|uniref:Acyl-homoserine-lactone synthase n=1 Tax=Marilutibacter maris TaxID=1605891 RepID=A0A508AAR9_9GAMM|nr:acyl-homoserine-lactone synthase [Lysobacter maris]KAB8175651.1 GNAT family N-acetyltransferase [Lysobacter maris]